MREVFNLKLILFTTCVCLLCYSINIKYNTITKPANIKTDGFRDIKLDDQDEILVLTIDSCEYLYITHSNTISHKGNCKYCKKRLEKLIYQSKMDSIVLNNLYE